MPPDAIGLPGTLYLDRERVRIIAGRFSADHARQFEPGASSILPEQRARRVAAVSGKRARRFPAVLIVDEVGYLTYGTDAAHMPFHVVNERHRRHRPMIFTTNRSLKAWDRVLHDEDLPRAIIDRVVERGRLLRLDGPSVRTLHVTHPAREP